VLLQKIATSRSALRKQARSLEPHAQRNYFQVIGLLLDLARETEHLDAHLVGPFGLGELAHLARGVVQKPQLLEFDEANFSHGTSKCPSTAKLGSRTRWLHLDYKAENLAIS
jgi:hypothetical protein